MGNIEDIEFSYTSKSTLDNGVLKNKLGINDEKTLEEVERQWTTYRLAQLFLNPGEQKFDINHYLGIHKYLFDKIYPFAGEIRSEITAKRIVFCLPQYIYSSLVTFLKDARDKSDSVYDRNSLLDFVVYLHTELDVIHAFREGNGRTNREFIRQYIEYICKKKGLENYYLDYAQIQDKDTYIDAVVKADGGDISDLTILFDSILQIKEKEKGLKSSF